MSTEPLTLIEWKAKEGDLVEQGDIVLVVETEKIRHDIEAEASGLLHILVEEGNESPIGSVAGLIAETKEELAVLQKEAPGKAAAAPVEAEATPQAPVAAAPSDATAEGERIRISPLARKLAEEHMIDITKVTGNGPGGRIVKDDIEREIAAKTVTPVEIAPEISREKGVKSTIPLTGMKKAIAEHMHRSLQVSAQLTLMGEIEMTEMVKLRKSLLAQEEAIGTRITYTDLLVFTIARALKDYPIINSSMLGSEIMLWEDINIAVAVALEDGLIVPVVKNADKKSLVEISQSVKMLAKKARERTLAPEEIQGGTFTITNLGAKGGGYRFETPIINQPESAILGTGGITDRAVVREGQIVIRPIMTYYFTYDHRVINGAVAAQFINSLARLLEKPDLLLL
jgi:pyruvate dehydrogenase E2 component (dihydrolipoamide acetyltransferase)/2-oxoglutarate dehydrogenase E2 component (dihydrolipoamide succinyltransferase)